MSLFDPRPRADPAAVARLKAWARELWDVPPDGSVTVTELRCSEPGCPPLETVVVISPRAGETFQRKVHRPAAEVTRADLDQRDRP